MSFAKNFGKLKQWTNERLGYAGRTEVSDHFKDLERIVDARRDAADTVFSVAEKYADAHAQRKFIGLRGINADFPIHALGTALVHFAGNIQQNDQDSKLAGVLATVGNLQVDLAHHQAAFLDKLTSGFLAEWSHYVSEGKKYAELKRKLESRRLDYDAKLNKVQRAKKEKPELEEEVRAALFKYEETMKEVETKMEYLMDFEDDGVNAAQLLVAAQIEFFEQSLTALHQAQAALGGNVGAARPKYRPPVADSLSLSSSAAVTPAGSAFPSGANTPSMGMLRENSRDSLSSAAGRPKPPSRSGSYHSNLSASGGAGGGSDSASALGLAAYQPPMPTQQQQHHLARHATATPPPATAAAAAPISQQSTGYSAISQHNTGYSATPAYAVAPAPTPAPAGSASTGGRRVRATFDFVAESDNELSLTVGDVVVVVHEVDAGWWIGERNGRRGMFPSNYVEPLGPEPAAAPAPASVHTPSPLAAASTRFGGSASNLHAASHSPGPAAAAAPVASAASVAVRAGGVPAMAVPAAAPPTAAASAAAVCGTCGCDEYKENVFKRGQCNNCFHAH